MHLRVLPIVLAAALLSLVGCGDDLATPDVSLKSDRGKGHGQEPDSAPPPSDPQDPLLPGFFLEGMRSPVRAFGTPEGRLLVSDARHRMILRVDPVSLQPDQAARVRGKPLGVAYHRQRIYVGNADGRTVEVYEAQGGSFAGDFGRDAVAYPSDIAVDPATGLVFVVDGIERMVKVFDAAGGLVRYVAGPGAADGELMTPVGIAVDTVNQEILVTDYGAPPAVKASIKIFAYDGTYVDRISGAGKCGMMGCSGGFSRPQGLGLDAAGRIYVADAVLSQVLVFDRVTKEIVKTLGGYPTLHAPSDVVITTTGDLFVVSTMTASVVSFLGGAR